MATQKLGFTLTPSYFVAENSHDGKVYRYAVAHTTLTIGTLYAILPDATNYAVTAAIGDDSLTYRVGVPMEATPADEVARLQTGGKYEGLTTPSISVSAGHTLEIAGGDIADGAALPIQDAQQFAVNLSGTTADVDEYDVYLLDREITASA